MSGYTYRRWTFSEMRSHMGDRWEDMPFRHWQEAGLERDKMPLDIDVARYEAAERNAVLKVFAVCLGGEPVGYAQYFITTHPHYKSTVWAISDTFYIEPEHRSIVTALGFFQFIEGCLREDGARFMYTTTEVDVPGAARVLERLGHTPAELSFVKSLGA